MKICVIPNSLVNVILILLYVKSDFCVKIDRELRDASDLLYKSNCESIKRVFIERGRCSCSIDSGIVSRNTGPIECIPSKIIAKSKHTWICFYSLLFSS